MARALIFSALYSAIGVPTLGNYGWFYAVCLFVCWSASGLGVLLSAFLPYQAALIVGIMPVSAHSLIRRYRPTFLSDDASVATPARDLDPHSAASTQK